MLKSIEVSARTEDEAIQQALDQLGLMRDDVSVEILERAKSGFLGIGSAPAVIRVEYEGGDDRAARTKEFLSGLLLRMGVTVGIEVSSDDDTISVALTGDDPGALIGRRGETLDAIQHLSNYVINRGASGRVRINVDAENYRQRRSETLETLAAKVAGKVVKYRRNMTLDPMNAYERHVIHAALQNYDNISTYSIGNEPNRRVVVAYGRKENREGRDDHREGRESHEGRESREGRGESRNRREQKETKNHTVEATGTGPSEYREWR